jgi:signal transduction histidine kinase
MQVAAGRTRGGARKLVVPLSIFGVGIALSVALFAYVRDDLGRDGQLRFERQAADATHIIEKRLRSYVDVTYGLRALFAAREKVSRAEFHHFVQSLDVKQSYPGFEVLNFARYIRAGEKQALEAEVRRDTSLDPQGYPDFSIKPPGNRSDYEVLIYLEPMEGNAFAFGRDIGFSPQQVRAQTRARESGDPVTSGRLHSIGKDRFVGLSMRLPVYQRGRPHATVEERRAAFVGTVGAGYNVRNLMHGVLDSTTMSVMRFRLYDAGVIGQAGDKASLTVLYDSTQQDGVPPDEARADPEARFAAVRVLNFGGRRWELHFNAPRTAFLEHMDLLLPWLALAGGILMSALLFAVLYAFASSRARAEALAAEMTHELRQSEAQIRDLLRRLVSAQEAERRRFSADLHDLVGQSLSVLGMGLETIRALLPGALPRKAESTIDHMGNLLKETMGSVRAVMSDLRPPLLDDYGLSAAIEWHARQLQARTGLRIAVEATDAGPRPAPEVEMALFRITQEALTNSAKHAAASSARVALARAGDRLTLVIEDDGRGIASPAANDPGPGGWGMAVMRERAAAVGGALRVDSSAHGTRIIVEVAER